MKWAWIFFTKCYNVVRYEKVMLRGRLNFLFLYNEINIETVTDVYTVLYNIKISKIIS